MKKITIDIEDVQAAGSVAGAIRAWADESDEVASGVVGPSFSTSGPGSGWSKNCDEHDYARRALSEDYGAAYYVDEHDGRVATLDEAGEVTWTKDSQVVMVAPDEDDARKYPEAVREMAEAVRVYHHAASDAAAWEALALEMLAD